MITDQWKFLQDIGKLINYALESGFVMTSGEFWRPEVMAWVNSLPSNSILLAEPPSGTEIHYWDHVGGVGIYHSLHRDRLAADFNFFTADGTIVTNIHAITPLGNFWQSLDTKNRAGMFFTTPDIYHFERNA